MDSKNRKLVWDSVVGNKHIDVLKEQMMAFVGVKQEAIMINRCWDTIESEATSLFAAMKEKDQSILNKMLMNLKVFLINNEQLHYCTSWNIVLYVLNKEFAQIDAYVYFAHLILGIFPAQYFDSLGRSLNCHIHNRVFGMLASNFASDL